MGLSGTFYENFNVFLFRVRLKYIRLEQMRIGGLALKLAETYIFLIYFFNNLTFVQQRFTAENINGFFGMHFYSRPKL